MAAVLSGVEPVASGFAFLRPAWLLAIPPVLLLVHRTARRLADAGWGRHIAPDKLAHLRLGSAGSATGGNLAIAASLTLACIALAGPSWHSSPEATARERQALVMLLDLSPSMLARDVAPDRLTRARLKLVDLLRSRADGESALIVYAADAFRVAPLTDDPAVIEALVPVLHPDIMPRPGSRPEAAVELALALFDGAALERGDIVAITDGMHPDAVAAIERRLPRGFRLSILGVGTSAGAPIPTADGGYLRDADGESVFAALDEAPLVALAERFGGRYVSLTVDSTDTDHLAALARLPPDPRIAPLDGHFDRRHDDGYWLVLVLLPLLACAFRRHLLWVMLPLMLTLAPEGQAFDWRGLWLTDDQRGARALERGDPAAAATRFANERWRAVARYRAGDHAGAAESLGGLLAESSAGSSAGSPTEATTADDHYNLGNALALAGDLSAALQAYERALTLYPAEETRADDARFNRAVVQALLDAERQTEEERDDRPPPRGGGEDDGADEEGEESERGADAGRESATSRAAVGGTAGGRAGTLDQRSLDGQDRATPARRDGPPESDPGAPDDATMAPERQAVAGTDLPAEAGAADSTLPVVEDNANRVLTPYGEQWLRALPQDPGAYLRRKFHYLAEIRARQGEGVPPPDERY